ncbi:MAG: hypothetical protein MI867_19930, partial [Pseudomonadales bacterium]|nr:hypothetical protein [Pseudomonadales bacterium]
LGCVLVGGSVSEVEIAPAFGGRLLESLLPFVSSETEYAGRLSGFDVGGSDLRLLVTDFAPYGLTIFVGVPLLRRLQRRPRAWLSGGALLVALAPWISLPGDYYEMGSTIVTGVLWWAGGDWSTLRSDDLFALVGGITGEPAAYGFDGIIGTATGAAVIVASICAAVSLAALTYAAGSAIALEPTTLELDESSDSKS